MELYVWNWKYKKQKFSFLRKYKKDKLKSVSKPISQKVVT